MNTLDFLRANEHKSSEDFVAMAQYVKDNWAWLKYSYAIAIKVRRRMQELGMTQKQLAEALGCSQQHVSVLLNGKVNMTLETLAKLENALQFDLIGASLESFDKESSMSFLNDSFEKIPESGLNTRSLVDGYKPRKKKGPKGKNR
ncbi:MAG: helix-turn-helix transcriptional regulator [Bacteroidales bacterium]|nr:helix-turn-helix transcriptional regulator [Bacteroidales bacterium]